MANITAVKDQKSVPRREILASMADGSWNYSISCAYNKIFYITGGKDGFEALNRTLVYKLGSSDFEETMNMNKARFSHSSTTLGSKVYVFGGRSKDMRVTASIEAFD